MANNFTYNPLGQSYEGKEGSGLAQILQPYQAGKYEVAKGEEAKNKAVQEAKAKEEKAERAKNIKYDLKLEDGWLNNATYLNELKNTVTEEYNIAYSDLYDNPEDKTAQENFIKATNDVSKANTEAKYSLQVADTYNKLYSFSETNDKVNKNETQANLNKVKNATIDEARKNGYNSLAQYQNSLLEDVVVFNAGNWSETKFLQEGEAWVESKGRNYGTGKLNGDVKKTSSGTIYSPKDAKDYWVAGYNTDPTMRAEIDDRFNKYKKPTGWDEMEKDEKAQWYIDNVEEEKTWRKILPPDAARNDEFALSDYEGGYKNNIILSDGNKDMKINAQFKDISGNPFSDPILLNPTVTPIKTISIDKKYLSDAPYTLGEDARRMDYDFKPDIPVKINRGLEVNIVYAAKEDIPIKIGSYEFTLIGGEPIPDELMKNQNFVNQNKNKIGTRNLTYAEVQNKEQYLGQPFHVVNDFEKFQSTLNKGAYDYTMEIINSVTSTGESGMNWE